MNTFCPARGPIAVPGKPMLAVGHEVSGTTVPFGIDVTGKRSPQAGH